VCLCVLPMCLMCVSVCVLPMCLMCVSVCFAHVLYVCVCVCFAHVLNVCVCVLPMCLMCVSVCVLPMYLMCVSVCVLQAQHNPPPAVQPLCHRVQLGPPLRVRWRLHLRPSARRLQVRPAGGRLALLCSDSPNGNRPRLLLDDGRKNSNH